MPRRALPTGFTAGLRCSPPPVDAIGVTIEPRVELLPSTGSVAARLLVALPWLAFSIALLVGRVPLPVVVCVLVLVPAVTVAFFRWNAHSCIRRSDTSWLVAGRRLGQPGWLELDGSGWAWRPRSVRREPAVAMPWSTVQSVTVTPQRSAAPRCRVRMTASAMHEFVLTAPAGWLARSLREALRSSHALDT